MILKGSHLKRSFLGGSDDKASAYTVRDRGSFLGQEDLLEKEMATHSSILAWKIPWMEEPGGLQVQGVAKRLHFLSLNRLVGKKKNSRIRKEEKNSKKSSYKCELFLKNLPTHES